MYLSSFQLGLIPSHTFRGFLISLILRQKLHEVTIKWKKKTIGNFVISEFWSPILWLVSYLHQSEPNPWCTSSMISLRTVLSLNLMELSFSLIWIFTDKVSHSTWILDIINDNQGNQPSAISIATPRRVNDLGSAGSKLLFSWFYIAIHHWKMCWPNDILRFVDFMITFKFLMISLQKEPS